MVAGVQGQWHEQLVAICAEEGSSPGKPGSWNREGPKRGSEGNRIIFLHQIILRPCSRA